MTICTHRLTCEYCKSAEEAFSIFKSQPISEGFVLQTTIFQKVIAKPSEKSSTNPIPIKQRQWTFWEEDYEDRKQNVGTPYNSPVSPKEWPKTDFGD